MKLVDDWKRFPRWFSTWVAGLIPLWAAMPADIKAHVPEALLPWLPLIWAAAFSAGRVVDQK